MYFNSKVVNEFKRLVFAKRFLLYKRIIVLIVGN